MYDDSFAGVAFEILDDDHEDEQAAVVTVRPIPGGSAVTIDVGGIAPVTRTMTILVQSDATWNALLAKIGTTGPLSNPDGLGSVQALLTGLRGRRRLPGGKNRAQATFLLLT